MRTGWIEKEELDKLKELTETEMREKLCEDCEYCVIVHQVWQGKLVFEKLYCEAVECIREAFPVRNEREGWEMWELQEESLIREIRKLRKN